MGKPAIHAVSHSHGTVTITIRQWDGIDRPDYTYVDVGNAADARHYADLLRQRADEADTFVKDKSAQELVEKRSALARLKDEVAKLEAELGA